MKSYLNKIFVLLIALLSLASCGNNTPDVAEITETTTEEITQITTTLPVKPTMTDGSYDYSYFDNCAFLGNSRFLALGSYGLVKNCFAVVGLTVDSVYTKSMDGSNVTVINELDGKKYDKIFILFGDNECGWPNIDVFRDKYEKLINSVKEKQPNAEIYATSIMPVSVHASSTSKYGVTNQNIDKANGAIEQAALNCDVKYLNPNEVMKNESGALPDEAASDGIHLTKEYCEKWLDYFYENT